MGVFFATLGSMCGLLATFVVAVVMTEKHDRRVASGSVGPVTPPPSHVRRIAP